jgi:hypothetical protein
MKKYFLILALFFTALTGWAQNGENANLAIINALRASTVTSVSAVKDRTANALDALNYSKLSMLQTYTATGTDTYAIASGPTAITAYTTGQIVIATFTNANTGAATININSVGASAIRDASGTALAADAIVAGGTYMLRYNGSHWRIVGATGAGGGGGGSSATVLPPKTVSTTTYTALATDTAYVVHLTNASGCTVTIPNTLPSRWIVTFIRNVSAGAVVFQGDGTSVLHTVGSSLTIEEEKAGVTWEKYNATDFYGLGALGPINLIENALNDGETDKGSAQDVLFDAFALKANDNAVVKLTGTQTVAGAKTFSTAPILSAETASRIAIIDASKNLIGATTATYPSLTELAHVKGLTSAAQTQLDAKAPLASPTFTGTVTLPAGTIPKFYSFAFSDEIVPMTAGVTKLTFHMPFAMTVTNIYCGLKTAQTSGSIVTIDINEAGSTILSTKITFDNGEDDSNNAAAAPVISDTSLAFRAKITVDIDQIGDGTAVGGKCSIVGY